MSANSQSTQNVLTSFAGHLAASRSTRGASGQRREFAGGTCPHLHAPRFDESCRDRSLRARWRRGLVAVGLGGAFERIGGGSCRLSRIGGSVRCQVVGGGFAGGR